MGGRLLRAALVLAEQDDAEEADDVANAADEERHVLLDLVGGCGCDAEHGERRDAECGDEHVCDVGRARAERAGAVGQHAQEHLKDERDGDKQLDRDQPQRRRNGFLRKEYRV